MRSFITAMECEGKNRSPKLMKDSVVPCNIVLLVAPVSIVATITSFATSNTDTIVTTVTT